MDNPDPLLEADLLLRAHEGKVGPCLATTSAQFAVLHGRSQLLLTLSTLTLTITGFSGPKIMASGNLARWALVFGLAFVLMGLVLLLLSNMAINFASQFLVHDEPRVGLAKLITYRNRKAGWYRWQLLCIVIGLTSYVLAVIHFLIVGQ